MELTLLVLVLLLKPITGVPISGTGAVGGSCLDLAYCNLIQGDIARESEKYGKDPSKFYKIAESNMNLYTENIAKNLTEEDKCKSQHDQCMKDTTDMTVHGLNFSISCNYKSYSRMIFRCENIKKWPESLITKMPTYATACEQDCPPENEPISVPNVPGLGSRNKMENLHMTGTGKAGLAGLEERSANSTGRILAENRAQNMTRDILSFVAGGFANTTNTSVWGFPKICPDDTWAHRVDLPNGNGKYLSSIAMVCSSYKSARESFDPRDMDIIDSRADLGTKSPTGKRYTGPCSNRPYASDHSFMIGISLSRAQFPDYGFVILQVNTLCANTYDEELVGVWGWDIRGPADTVPLVCPYESAICAIQTRSDSYGSERFITDVGIGCCAGDGDPNHLENFRQTVSNPTDIVDTPWECESVRFEQINIDTLAEVG